MLYLNFGNIKITSIQYFFDYILYIYVIILHSNEVKDLFFDFVLFYSALLFLLHNL